MMFIARPPCGTYHNGLSLQGHEACLTITLLRSLGLDANAEVAIMKMDERKGGREMAYRIMIVDDEPTLQNMVQEILSQAG